MTKNGHSNFFLTIFHNTTGINLEWPKMAIPNFFQQVFPQKNWYQFRMAIFVQKNSLKKRKFGQKSSEIF